VKKMPKVEIKSVVTPRGKRLEASCESYEQAKELLEALKKHAVPGADDAIQILVAVDTPQTNRFREGECEGYDRALEILEFWRERLTGLFPSEITELVISVKLPSPSIIPARFT